ncbi:MMPL family transporter [Agarivorans sp. QJM3NY_33]|uniref:MMPL family transporter n=1 Tax=Agarivorans sp. QJM3NY_33 TaxID=3421432 RepID=UPI003D7D5A6B
MTRGRFAAIWLACLFSLALFLTGQVTQGIRLNSDIMSMLPVDQQRPATQQIINDVSARLERRLYFIIEAKSLAVAQQALISWRQTTDSLPIDYLNSAAQGQSLASTLYPYRYQLLDKQAHQWLQQQQSKPLTERALRDIYNPFAGVSSQELLSDPWLLFRQYIVEALPRSPFKLDHELLVSQQNNKVQVLLQAELKASPYTLESARLIDHLRHQATALEQQLDVKIWYQGNGFYASHGVLTARSEISLIGGGSLLAIIILILLVFRSVSPLLLCGLSIGCGLLTAFSLTLLIFGSIHSFTLVVGASLIGVSIDYAFHYMSYRACYQGQWQAKQAINLLQPALVLGLISSLLAYVGLMVAEFPGLQQLALFCSMGLLGAFLTVLLLYPKLTTKPARYQPLKLAQRLQQCNLCWLPRKLQFSLLLVALLFCCGGGYLAQFDDDVRQLQSPPIDLKQHEQQMSELTGVEATQQWLVVLADSPELLLQQEQQARVQLDNLVQNQQLKHYIALSQLIPSVKQQQQNYYLSKQLIRQQGANMRNSLGLAETPHLPTFSSLKLTRLMDKQQLSNTPYVFGQLANQRFYSIIFLNHPDAESLRSLARTNTDLIYIDRASEISQLLTQYRQHATYLLVIAYLGALLLFWWRFTLNQALRILIAPLLASGIALAVPGYLGLPINLFNILGIILVLGIGVDYSLFYRFHGDQAHTSLAVVLAGTTTFLSFGLMASSSNHAIASFGITIAVGILAAWLFSPMAQPGFFKRNIL